ncbi:GIY-YIG nuclease family protein [Echinicola shivajiensis]|uniref:GIY-YIG nuclease family protein n=1 Tax=Echinicola shivajiensis TaxID=1035916 RepID=UPI001BFC8DF1
MSIFKVYILYSKSIDTFYYIGFSSDLSQRIDQHREHGIKGSFTNRAEDWELYFSLSCRSEDYDGQIGLFSSIIPSSY